MPRTVGPATGWPRRSRRPSGLRVRPVARASARDGSAWSRSCVRAASPRGASGDPEPGGPFRGLYLSEELERLLAPGAQPPGSGGERGAPRPVEAAADQAEAAGALLRLRLLAVNFGLTDLDVEIAPGRPRARRRRPLRAAFGYLHDDVTRRRASIGLALELAGGHPRSAPLRARVRSGAPLVDGGCSSVVEEPDTAVPDACPPCPRPRRACTCSGTTTSTRRSCRLLASRRSEPRGATRPRWPARSRRARALLRARAARVVGPSRSPRRPSPSSARPSLALDLARLVTGRRQAARSRSAPCARPASSTRASSRAPSRRCSTAGPTLVAALREAELARGAHRLQGWDPAGRGRAAPRRALAAGAADRSADVGREPRRRRRPGSTPPGRPPSSGSAPSRSPRAAAARLQASLAGRRSAGGPARRRAPRTPPGSSGSRGASSPDVGWDDMVLPPETPPAAARGRAGRAPHRDHVLDDWGLRAAARAGRGITALFAGESGTGQDDGRRGRRRASSGSTSTRSTSPRSSTSTSARPRRTSTGSSREAEQVNGVLFFDEADALFGKRSEVQGRARPLRERRDRVPAAAHGAFDGIAILATNLRANIDEAFARRLDAVVDFPMPDAERAAELWERCLGPVVPRADDVDLEFCAASVRALRAATSATSRSPRRISRPTEDRAVGMAT